MNSNLHIYDNNNNDNNVDNNYNIIIILQAHSIVISDVDEVAREETRLVKQSFDRISNPKPSQKRSQNFSAIKSSIAGPTCDSADVLYEKSDYEMPLALAAGDRVEIMSTGAYTTTYSAVAFNGFAPLRQVVI